MTYYYLENKIDAKETGNVFPQVTCESIHLAHQIQFDEFSYFDSELLFLLTRKAKLTSVLSQAAISARGLLINNVVKDLFANFNLMEHRFYKSLIKDYKGTLKTYRFMHLADQSFVHKINYNESKFYTRESGFRENDVQLKSFEDYLSKKKELGILWTINSDYIHLSDSFNKDLDLFTIPFFDNRIYVSDKLKNEIDKVNLTGLKVAEASSIGVRE